MNGADLRAIELRKAVRDRGLMPDINPDPPDFVEMQGDDSAPLGVLRAFCYGSELLLTPTMSYWHTNNTNCDVTGNI